jgi:hypothetical protein
MSLLVAPGLLAHAAACRARPALARLARYAGAPSRDPDGLAMLTCRTLGIPGDPPVAALTAVGAGLAAGGDYWLMADPVTLVPGRTDVTLAGAVRDLTRDQTDELLIALNAHFHGDGLAFVAPRPNLWLAHLAETPLLQTAPLDRARNEILSDVLPHGEAAAQWRRWQDEIQMLLHTHPVNDVRESGGALPANAVWFWGGGRQVDARDAPAVRVDAPPTRLGDLARGIGQTASMVSTSAAPPRAVIVAEPIDSDEGVAAFVETVLEPALHDLEHRVVAQLSLLADGAGAALAWHASAPTRFARLAARWQAAPFKAPEGDAR